MALKKEKKKVDSYQPVQSFHSALDLEADATARVWMKDPPRAEGMQSSPEARGAGQRRGWVQILTTGKMLIGSR